MDAISTSCLNPDGLSFKRGTIVFYWGTSFFDTAVQVGEGGGPTHVVVALGDGSAICAWAGGGGMPQGVMNKWQDYPPVRTQFSRIEARPAPVQTEVLKAYLGRPYDFPGLVAAFLARWFGIKIGGPPQAFTCSSLIAWVWPRDWGMAPRDVTPNDVWLAATVADPK